jgi:hypothetical protein
MNFDYNYLCKLKKEELNNYNKFHLEAWKARLNNDFDLMLEKQKEAERTLYKSRSYDYIIKYIDKF